MEVVVDVAASATSTPTDIKEKATIPTVGRRAQ
jgi:hypothetical protein